MQRYKSNLIAVLSPRVSFKRRTQPLLLALQTKLQIARYREIVTLSTESIINLFEVLHMQPEIICLEANLTCACKA